MADLSLTIALSTPGIELWSERLNEAIAGMSERLVGVRAWNAIAETCGRPQMKVAAQK